MNRFAAFDFSADEKINELCQKYPLAGGTNVFVSEGKLLVQYQDGQPETPAVKRINLAEQVNSFERAKADLILSNQVNARQIADAENRVTVAQAELDRIQALIDGTKRGSTKLKEDHADTEEKYKAARGQLRDVKGQKLLNDAEIARIEMNIELFKEQIAAL